MLNNLLQSISSDYEELAITQAAKLPKKFWIANEDKQLRKRWKGSGGVWKHHYIAHATEHYINAIIIDVDSNVTADAILSVLPANLRPASITGPSKTKNYQKYFVRPHVRFNLLYPVKKDSEKQLAWLKNITAELQRLISQVATVDPNTPSFVTKNPLSGKWDYQTFGEFAFKEYDLAEISQILNLKRYRYDNPTPKSNVFEFKTKKPVAQERPKYPGRNEELFHETRQQCYSLAGKFQSNELLYSAVLNLCKSNNFAWFEIPLSNKEVEGIARSITRFVWYDFNPGNFRKSYNVGAASKYISDDDDLRKRMQIGAHYANKVRSTKAIETISRAISEAREKGLDISKKYIAAQTKMSINTVRKYWDDAQNSNVIKITNADYKLHELRSQSLTKGGITTPLSRKDIPKQQKETIKIKPDIQISEPEIISFDYILSKTDTYDDLEFRNLNTHYEEYINPYESHHQNSINSIDDDCPF